MNIILYTKTGCPWCAGVLKLFREKNVLFEEREVLGNPEYFKELVQKSGQTKTPTLDIDGHIIADSDADAVSAYLHEQNVSGF
ncbi:MAG: glutaredoxin [Patescibacteria group bacterium]